MNRLRYRPRLENLEDRTAPAVGIQLTSTSLNITGDNARAGSFISVSLVADPDTGDVLFQVDTSSNDGTGPVTSNFYPVRPNVNVRTGKYGDHVVFNGGPINTPDASAIKLNVDLGRGNDVAEMFLNGLTLSGNSSINASINGGDGNDTLTADLFGTIEQGSTLSLQMNGGSDRDTVTVGNTQGRLALYGTLNVSLYGSGSRDTIAADLVFQPVDAKDVQGTFNGYLRGGLSRDNLRLTVANTAATSGNVRYNGRIDAGPLDTVVASVGTVVKHAFKRKTTFVAVTNELPEVIEM